MKGILRILLILPAWVACSNEGNQGDATQDHFPPIGSDDSAERENDGNQEESDGGIPEESEWDTENQTGCEPGTTAECASLDIGYSEGQAVCTEDGVWDLTSCFLGDNQAESYGYLAAADEVAIRYFLNGNRMEDQMYLAMHSMHVLPKAVFRGEYGQETFPPTGGNVVHMTYGWHVWTDGEGQLLVLQYSSTGMTPVSPMLQLIFTTDEVEPGVYTMGEEVAASVIELDATTEYQCVSAVAYGGSVEVTAAKNTTQKEGGSLSYRIPHDIKLYHPSDTPYGDLSESFAGTIEVCPHHLSD